MEKIKKHWQPILLTSAVGVALAAYFLLSDKKNHSKVQSLEYLKNLILDDAQNWPSAIRIIDSSLPLAEQKRQLDDWVESVFKEFIRQHGPIKSNSKGTLEFNDFIEIYQLIETFGRFELHEVRNNNEERRKEIFRDSFAGEGDERKMEEYIDNILRCIDEECDLYAPALTKVLKIAGVQQLIWESSMEVNLPVGETFLKYATIVGTSSPFTYQGSKTKVEILDIYR